MKIKITYKTDQELAGVLNAILNVFPSAKVHESDKHSPYKHVYLSIKEQRQNAEKQGKTVDAPCSSWYNKIK